MASTASTELAGIRGLVQSVHCAHSLVHRSTDELGSEVVASRDLLLVTVGGRLDRSCQAGNTAPVTEAQLGGSIEATQILVVTDTERSRAFWTEVLGAEVYREYETSVVLRFASSWLLLVTGGDPTPDKPTVNLVPPTDPDQVSHLITVRVQDCRAAYEALRARGAEFLTPPYNRGAEVRCFLRDLDGHLIELSEVT